MTRGNGQRGQGLIEYTLIMVLVVLVAIALLAWFGPTLGNIFSGITGGL